MSSDGRKAQWLVLVYQFPQGPGLLTGIVAGIDDDLGRIERGRALFDDLYRFFSEAPN